MSDHSYSSHTPGVKPRKLQAYQAHWKQATELVESEEPRMIAFNGYASEDGTDVSTVQVHPDSESLDVHLKIFFEKLKSGPSRPWTATRSTSTAPPATPFWSRWARCRACACGCYPYIRAASCVHSRCDRALLSRCRRALSSPPGPCTSTPLALRLSGDVVEHGQISPRRAMVVWRCRVSWTSIWSGASVPGRSGAPVHRQDREGRQVEGRVPQAFREIRTRSR